MTTQTGTRLVAMEAGERLVHSCRVETLQQVRSGGLILKITVWESDGVQWDLHLTNRRLLLEPVRLTDAQKWGQRAALAATGLLLAGAGVSTYGTVATARRRLARDHRNSDRAAGSVLTVPLTEITGAELFTRMTRWMVRIRIADLPADALVVGIHGGAPGSSRPAATALAQAIGEARTRR